MRSAMCAASQLPGKVPTDAVDAPAYTKLMWCGYKIQVQYHQKIVCQDQFLLNAGQKYCRMPQGEHSATLSTFIKLPFCHYGLCFVYF